MDEPTPICVMCRLEPEGCVCPICPVCDIQGDPRCFAEGHIESFTDRETQHHGEFQRTFLDFPFGRITVLENVEFQERKEGDDGETEKCG